MDRKKQQVPPLRFAPVGGCDFFNFLWLESCEAHLPISIAGVLRLRAVSPVLSDRSARRFAQDDDSVVGIKNIGSSAKNTKRSKKSQALRMTNLWGSQKINRRSLHYAPPDFLWRLVALASFLRLSLPKAAHAGVGECTVAGNPGSVLAGGQ